MRRFLLTIILGCLLSSAVHAQQAVTVRVSETQLNQAVSHALRETIVTPLGTVETMLVDVQNANVVLRGSIKRPDNEFWIYKITLASTVIAQKSQWIIDDATYTDVHTIKSPRDSASGQASGKLIDVWEHAVATVNASNLPRPISVIDLAALPVASVSLSSDTITTAYLDNSHTERFQPSEAMSLTSFNIDLPLNPVGATTPTPRPSGIIAILIGLIAPPSRP